MTIAQRFSFILLCGTMCGLASLGYAQQYPAKPIRLIVPYPPGGTTDIVAREVTGKVAEGLGTQVIVDNRPGAATFIGLTLGAKAPPDGYTITFGTSAGLAVNPALGVKMPFDPLKDFAPIGVITFSPFFLVVHPSLPVRNVKELVALAKAHPGKLNFASPGVGTPNHLGIELLQVMAGVKFVHVPYKGGAPALIDLVAGQVQLFWSSTPQIASFLKQGRLRIIAAGTQTPSRIAPQYPPVAETYPGYDCNTWYGLLAPAGTAPAIVTRLNTELNRVLTDPAMVQRLLDQGVEARPGTPAALTEMIVSETERWRKVIKNAGITAEAAQ
jgi:tripartite-type tricarboxylate transporter receptor subunit TctC